MGVLGSGLLLFRVPNAPLAPLAPRQLAEARRVLGRAELLSRTIPLEVPAAQTARTAPP